MWLALCLALLLPGFCVAIVLNIKKELLFLAAVPFSLLLYTIICVSLYLPGITYWIFPVYLLISTGLIIVVVSFLLFRKRLIDSLISARHCLPLLIGVTLYNLFAGAFVDYGVDLFRHMMFTQVAIASIVDLGGEIRMNLNPGTHNLVFHNIAAKFAVWNNISAPELIEVISLAYSLLWTLSIYFFSRMVLSLAGIPLARLIPYSYLAVFFYWTTFGINNFSFPRYYVGGPAILNYCVYLSALGLVLFQFAKGFSFKDSMLVVLFVGLAGFLHQQEALLFLVFVMGLSLVLLCKTIFKQSDSIDIPGNRSNIFVSAIILVGSLVAMFLAIYLSPKYRFDPVPLLNLGEYSERFRAWSILRPDHQFYTALGLWGLYVYILSFLYIKSVSKSTILTVSIILPVITVFNPVFTEAYMKIAYPQVLWRVLFALQLPIVAAYLVWIVLSKKDGMGLSRSLIQYSSLIPLIIFLLPFQAGPINNQMVKTPSLVPTPTENSYLHWNGLIEYLNGIDDKQSIITDPVTGYAVRSLTKHSHRGFKFFPNNSIQYNFDSYDDHPLRQNKGSLLVVNLEDGEINHRLRPPLHIYSDVMMVSKYYEDTLLEELKDREDRYEKIWQENNLTVYRIL